MSKLVDVLCGVDYCGQLIGKAEPGSVVELKCHRCYAYTKWDDGETTITRPPRRIRETKKPGKPWRSLESPEEIADIMSEPSAVEGIRVKRERDRARGRR